VWRRMCLSTSVSVGLMLLPLPKAVRRGAALFRGKERLHAKIRGHDDFLPPEAVRCLNCHRTNDGPRLSRVAAPHLDRSFLTSALPRRSGPPSRYDEPSFCKLLRTGVDPAFILVAREMPAFVVTDEQCSSLWVFLMDKGQPD
jgi:hypothetical protein